MSVSVFPWEASVQGNVIIIAGPTACGKSALAMDWAEQYDGVIINGDSIQLYRGLPILTACPDLHDKKRVPHRLYEITDSAHSAVAWTERAWSEITALLEQNKTPFVVSGTGFYLSMLVHGFTKLPAYDPAERQKIEYDLRSDTVLLLQEKLKRIDPHIRYMPADRYRLTYQIAIHTLTGKPLSWWSQTAHQAPPACIKWHKYLVWPSKNDLIIRAMLRFDTMLAQGLMQEMLDFCHKCISSGVDMEKHPLRRAIGFATVRDWAEGRISQEICKERYAQEIKSLVKKQYTWFRTQYMCDQRWDGLWSGFGLKM